MEKELRRLAISTPGVGWKSVHPVSEAQLWDGSQYM